MNESFFLTKQTANLMEDFDRELNADSALFLLYGETRVGKSRLLQELIKTRLGERRVHGIELRSSDQDGKGKQDRSDEIEKIFASAKNGDIIIADHFESALKKTRHQLFVSWSTDGIDKQLYVIVCSNLDGFNELRELALRYHVSARSFHLKPFGSDEIEAFFAFYLFQDQLVGKLIFPPYLRKQIAQSRGVVGNLIDIAIRDGDQIENLPLNDMDPSTQKRWIVGTLMVMVLLAAGLGWYLNTAPDSFESLAEAPMQPETSETIALNQTGGASLTREELVFEPDTEAVIDSTMASEDETAPGPQSETSATGNASAEEGSAAMAETVTEPEPEPAPQPAIEAEVASEEEITSLAAAEEAAPVEADDEIAATSAVEVASIEPEVAEIDAAPVSDAPASAPSATVIENPVAAEPGAETETQPVAAETETKPVAAEAESGNAQAEQTRTASVAPVEKELSLEARFERDLRTSLEWLGNRADQTGMVQIMLLRVRGFDLQKYYDFLDRLERRNVDLTRVRVFRTMTANRVNYSVFYDEFPSRRDAMRSLEFLPDAIRGTSPIPRSVGGLRDEIRRLGADN